MRILGILLGAAALVAAPGTVPPNAVESARPPVASAASADLAIGALARSVPAELDAAVAVLDKRRHRHGAFAALKAAELPAILVGRDLPGGERERSRLGSAGWGKRTVGTLHPGLRAPRGVERQPHEAPPGEDIGLGRNRDSARSVAG